MVTVALYDINDPNGGWVLIDPKHPNRGGRVYPNQQEAQKAANRINAARARYERNGDIVLSYYDLYHTGRGWITSDDLPPNSPPYDTEGTAKGRGFQNIFMNNGYEDMTLREIKENHMGNADNMAFLRSAVISHPDPNVRRAISQYFFISSIQED